MQQNIDRFKRGGGEKEGGGGEEGGRLPRIGYFQGKSTVQMTETFSALRFLFNTICGAQFEMKSPLDVTELHSPVQPEWSPIF